MKVAIIGAGFTGLAAAWDISQNGHEVTLIEAEEYPGGLASGFTTPEWEWSLEHHYHHIFASDKDIQELVAEMDLSGLMQFRSTQTDVYYNKEFHRLDSPESLIKLTSLDLISRLRTALTLAYLKANPWWQSLERLTAQNFIRKTMGEKSWQVLWQPLFSGKFGDYSDQINAAWFWARIHVRTKQLGYFKGGFLNLAEQMVHKLKSNSVKTFFNTSVTSVATYKGKFRLQTKNHLIDNQKFDLALVATPSFILRKIVKDLPTSFIQSIDNLQGLGAQTLVLELDKPFFKTNTYWLNINEPNWPILAVVEHTNFVDPKYYNGKRLLYVGKYLDSTDKQYQLTKDELLEIYHPYLSQLSPNFKQSINRSWLFKTPFAQPIAGINHSQNVPSLDPPIPGLFWASMQHVYPWDRGTNFAVRLGREIAKRMLQA